MLFGGGISDLGVMQTVILSVPVRPVGKPRFCERWGDLSQASLCMLISVFSEVKLPTKRAYLGFSVL